MSSRPPAYRAFLTATILTLLASFPAFAQPPQGVTKVGTVEGGYRFMGGDPSKASSWGKI